MILLIYSVLVVCGHIIQEILTDTSIWGICLQACHSISHHPCQLCTAQDEFQSLMSTPILIFNSQSSPKFRDIHSAIFAWRHLVYKRKTISQESRKKNWKKYNCACRWHIAVVPKYLQADCRGGVVGGWWWWVGGGGWVVGGGSWVVVGGVRAGGSDTFYIFTKCYCSVMVNVFVWCVWLEYTHVDILINSRPSIQWF